MNLEDSKSILATRLQDLDHGESLLIDEGKTEDMLLIWYLEDRYLILKFLDKTYGVGHMQGKWIQVKSHMSILNMLSSDIIISWACDLPLP